MVARSKRDGSGEQHLSRHDRIALRRFESGEPEAVLRIIGHVEIHVRLPTVQPPQGFRGNRRICRQGAVRHLGDERRRNRIVGTGNVASRCVARTHQNRIVELHARERNFRILDIVDEYSLDFSKVRTISCPEWNFRTWALVSVIKGTVPLR